MSLFVTEILGYPIEIYPGTDLRFLEWLYKNDRELLKRLLEKRELDRQFVKFPVMPHCSARKPRFASD